MSRPVITKEQREKDRAICEAVTKPLPWTYSTSNSHRWFLSDGCGAVAYGTKLRDGADDIVIDDRDGKHLENAANRLPSYIADAEEMERRIAEAATAAEAAKEMALRGPADACPEYGARYRGMLQILRILRGER